MNRYQKIHEFYTKPRDLAKVLDRLVEVMPELAPKFRELRASIDYTAPEQRWTLFAVAQEILWREAPWPTHPKSEALRLIWNDET